MATGGENFFDVLIDRLIVDVKNDFEAARKAEHESSDGGSLEEFVAKKSGLARDSSFDEPEKKRAPQFDDLVSKMIGFRSRITTPKSNQPNAMYLEAPRKFETSAIQIGAASATRAKACPKFVSTDAQIAYTLVVKSGAQFYPEDLVNDSLSREALKRERRRVLLTLHPDRVPETDRAKAHERFLAAADAFSVLANQNSQSRAA